VTEDHETIDQLLAGYVLRSLSEPDAAEADRLLAEHVPGCADCRMTLDSFGSVVADLALEAPVVQPPETLLPALHRELEARPRERSRRWNPARVGAVAAGFVVVIGLGGFAVTQFGGDADGTLAQGDIREAVKTMLRHDATRVDLGAASEIYAPGLPAFYLLGADVPPPPSGHVYRLWTVSGGRAAYVGDFRPDENGMVVIRIERDPSSFDEVLVTAEPIASTPSIPGDPAWQATTAA
jgi:Anti-sigma-K factor rskA